jgi:hypothetical protein
LEKGIIKSVAVLMPEFTVKEPLERLNNPVESVESYIINETVIGWPKAESEAITVIFTPVAASFVRSRPLSPAGCKAGSLLPSHRTNVVPVVIASWECE